MVAPKNIESVSKNDAKNLLNSIDFALFDIDGVLLHNMLPIPGALEAVAKLRKLGKRIGFATNNPAYSVKLLSEKLKCFNGTPEEIISPNHALLYYLKEIGCKKDIYVIGLSLVKQLLRDEGYTVLDLMDIDANPIKESIDAVRSFNEKAIDICKNVGVVLIDVDPNSTLMSLQAAQIISNTNKDVIVLSGMNDDTVPISSNQTCIGAKYMIDGIERWCKRKCIEMGKPGKVFKYVLEKKFKVTNSERVLMFGDNVETDIAFGANCGYKTCLLYSGISKKHQVEQWTFPEKFKPNYTAESLAVFYEKIKNL